MADLQNRLADANVT